MPFIDTYINNIHDALHDTEDGISEAIKILSNLRDTNGRLWVLGNGGSLAIAQHFAQDLVKMRRLRAHAMICPSTITAYTNDVDFSHCFTMPLDVLKDKKDPVLIFSCSGRSTNYQNFKYKKIKPLIAVVGTDGGFLKEIADITIHVKSNNYQVCETAFSVVADLINMGLEDDKNA